MRQYIENVAGRPLDVRYDSQRYVLPRGKTFVDEAFPEVSRDQARAIVDLAHSHYHSVDLNGAVKPFTVMGVE